MCLAQMNRKTLVIDGAMDHPLFCLLDIIFALAIDDKASEADHAHDVKNIFWAKILESISFSGLSRQQYTYFSMFI